MKIILHPTDFSTNSDRAFGTACSLARDEAALLIVLHTVNPIGCDPADIAGDELIPDREHFHQIWCQFDRLKGLAGNTCLTFRIHVGEVVDSIVHVARDEHCDMIVLAGRNETHEHDQAHGCISEGVIRRAPCSVLTLRHFHSPASNESRVEKKCQSKCSSKGACRACSEKSLVSLNS